MRYIAEKRFLSEFPFKKAVEALLHFRFVKSIQFTTEIVGESEFPAHPATGRTHAPRNASSHSRRMTIFAPTRADLIRRSVTKSRSFRGE